MPADAKIREDLQAWLDMLQDKDWKVYPWSLNNYVMYYDGRNFLVL